MWRLAHKTSVRSQSQYRLRDDVLLNLVRAAIDRDLAPVEIMRRQGARPFRADRRLVPAIVAVGFLGQRVRADRLEQQLADGLLDFASLDLQDRRGRVRLVALSRAGDDAKLGHFERLQLHLDGRDLHAEPLVLDQRLVADALKGGDLLEPADARLRGADTGDAGALVTEQEFGVIPAAAFLADAVLDGHAHVVEEHFVDLAAAIDGLDRPHRDAGRLHVDQEERYALLLLCCWIGAHQAEDPVGILRRGGPGLLAVDDVVVAVPPRRRRERGEVGAGAGLRKALAP